MTPQQAEQEIAQLANVYSSNNGYLFLCVAGIILLAIVLLKRRK